MKTMKRLGRLLLIAVFSLSALSVSQISLAASNVDGSISGQVLTSGGDGVSGATVTVSNPSTGLSRSVTTDADGSFRFSAMPVGSYVVSADSSQGQASRNATVNVGTTTPVQLVLGESAAELGTVTAAVTAISPIDITSTESATIMGEATIDRIPVPRTVTDVALLAPGTTRGDTAFGNLASFGGATVGENVCYINGLNVTNFRNGLGCSTVPFEFYQEFQLKTGGYSAEFGRATGGVINAVTKSGTNDYKYGFNLFLEPYIDGFNTNGENTYYPWALDASGVIAGGAIYGDRESDETNNLEANVYASGPIIKDKAFFYVLYNMRDQQTDNYNRASQSFFANQSDDAFWGAKLDFSINSAHALELTAFSDERSIVSDQYPFTPNGAPSDYDNWSQGAYEGTLTSDRGGMNYIVRYVGQFSPDFTLNVMYGQNEYDLSDISTADACPLIIDVRSASTNSAPGCWVNTLPGTGTDTREALRIDAEYFIGDHQLKFGFDQETNTSESSSLYSGGYYWRYFDSSSSPTGEVARLRYYENSGSFETLTSALYVEDTWSVTDTLVLRLGLRNESFENQNAAGAAFIDISSQIAPRLGLSWDAMGDGTLKVFANYGRYYLPVANNTNVRLAGAETFTEAYFVYTGNVDPVTGAPTSFQDANGDTFTFDPANVLTTPELTTNYLGAVPLPGRYNIYADGSVADTSSIVDANIDPMYQDEFIVGFQRDLGDGWSFTTRAIFRDLGSTLEDLTTDAAFSALGFDAEGCGIGAFHYVLANPGNDVTITWDCPTGTPATYTLTAAQLGYPESERYYNAVEMLIERVWDGKWFVQGSYTWSQSYGNNEGYVRSDNGQDDAGLTTLFDFPGLLDGAYGPLPNDRTHALKLFGAYQFADAWRVGANLLMQSGRPINAFGVHATDPFAQLYGSESFFQNGVPVPRGSRGRTPFQSSLDLSLDYNTKVGTTDMNFGVDVFNVFGANTPTEVNEEAELDSGAANRAYLLPTAFQNGRYMRLRAQFDF